MTIVLGLVQPNTKEANTPVPIRTLTTQGSTAKSKVPTRIAT